MKYLSVRNLKKYQHYRERRPIWVKLYQKTLEDVEFTCLPDASKAHALLILLIASRYDNRIPWDARWIGNAIHATEIIDLDLLIASGFLVDAEALSDASNPASTPLAKRARVASPKRRENRKQNKHHGSSGDEPFAAEFEALWALYPKRPNNPKKPAFKAYVARRRSGIASAEISAGLARYADYVAACVSDPKMIKQAQTFFGPDEHWSELYEIPAAKPGSVAGSIGASPLTERARTLHALGKQYKLFAYNGNKAEYGEKMAAAEADPRAGDTFRADASHARMWEGIGTIQHERFAIDEIARRLDAAGVKVAGVQVA